MLKVVFYALSLSLIFSIYFTARNWKEVSGRDFVKLGDVSYGTMECKWLFSLNTDYLNTLDKSRTMKLSLSNFVNSKNGQPYLTKDLFFHLSKHLPNNFELNRGNSSESEHILTSRKILSSLESVKFIPCKTVLYDDGKIISCGDFYQQYRKTPLRITFIGDSMIRSIMEEMVILTKNILDLKIIQPLTCPNETNSNESVGNGFCRNYTDMIIEKYFLNKKYKSDIFFAGRGIEIRFYWAPYLMMRKNPDIKDYSQGVKDLLTQWARKKEDPEMDPIPDILHLGGGMWDYKILRGLIGMVNYIQMIRDITPLLNEISKRTRVIWHVHPTYLEMRDKDYHINDDLLHWMNQLSYIYLSKNDNIWLWDTLAVFAVKEKLECFKYLNLGLPSRTFPKSFHCQEAEHPGEDVREVAVNMILNVACNKVIKLNKMTCC